MPTFLRQDQAYIQVDVPSIGFQPWGSSSWAVLEGGDLESEDTKTRPGGMQPQVTLGGPTTRSDATVSRPYTRENHPVIVPLEESAGRGLMSISYTILDGAGHAGIGPVVTLKGILKNVNRPNFDSNAAGTAMLAIVMGCNVAAHITE